MRNPRVYKDKEKLPSKSRTRVIFFFWVVLWLTNEGNVSKEFLANVS